MGRKACMGGCRVVAVRGARTRTGGVGAGAGGRLRAMAGRAEERQSGWATEKLRTRRLTLRVQTPRGPFAHARVALKTRGLLVSSWT